MTISPDEKSAAEGPQDLQEEFTGPFIGSDIPEPAYLRIGEILRAQQSFDLAGYKDLCIKRRIAARIRLLGMSGPDAYVALLEDNQAEQQKLLTALSIHVSHFFRNPSTFKVLEKHVLPELIEVCRDQGSKLRVWSVGCANGEEPYSLALLGQQLLGESDLLKIIGTDLSSEAIVRAKRGQYDPSRITEVSDEMLQQFFICQENRYSLAAKVKNKVRFFRHDILSDQPFYRADLILCRNVLIYFSREQQRQVLQVLAAALPAGGFLVLGRAETLVASCRELFRCIDPAERIYQRLNNREQILPTRAVEQLQDF